MKKVILASLLCFTAAIFAEEAASQDKEAEIGKIFTNNENHSQSEQVVRDFLLAVAANDLGKVDQFADQNVRITTVNDLKQMHYAKHAEMSKNLKVRIRALHSSLDNIKIEVQNIIQEGNQVFAYYTLSGIQKGNFLGIAPTDKPVFIRVMSLFTVEDGKIDTITEMWNEYSVMKQLSHFLL